MSNDSNLFYIVMEAEGDELEAFEDAPAEEEIPSNNQSNDNSGDAGSSPNNNNDLDGPPPMADDSDFQYSDEDSNGEAPQEEDNTANDKKDEKLSVKANNILNQKLYQQMLKRNSEIKELIDNIQTLTPVLPYEIITKNDESLTQLKSAYTKGSEYVIDKFIHASYGENLLYFQKLNSLYTLLLDKIDTNLKKVKSS